MLGVPIEGPTQMLCDSQSVVMNSSFPESVLKKEHCSISYHIFCETMAANTIHIYCKKSKSNLADLFTKILSSKTRNERLKAILN